METFFGNNLKKLRKKFNYSQEDFSNLIGYSCQNISKWETGKAIPNLDILNDICAIFGVKDLDSLVNKKIDYYQYDIDKDIEFVKAEKLNINARAIYLYYDLIQGKTMFKADDEVIDCLTQLKEHYIISEFELFNTDDFYDVRFKLSNDEDDLSLRNIMKKNDYKKVDFASDIDYYKYVDSLNLSKQCLIVLDYIDTMENVNFRLVDLYNDELIDILKRKYMRNKDQKKIIRTSLAKICEYGILIKEGYALYKKKHHKITDEYQLTDQDIKRLNSFLKLEFNDYHYRKELFIKELDFLGSNGYGSINKIKKYFVYLVNIGLVYNYEINVKDEKIIIDYYVEVE